MKKAIIVLLGMIIMTASWAQNLTQNKNFDYTDYGQMIYWRAMNLEEKKVFLHAYLYRTHEISKEMRQSRKLKSSANRYVSEIADPVYKIFRDLDEKQKSDLIFWIDTFYQREFNREESFINALDYASKKLKSSDKTMNDVYKSTYPQ